MNAFPRDRKKDRKNNRILIFSSSFLSLPFPFAEGKGKGGKGLGKEKSEKSWESTNFLFFFSLLPFPEREDRRGGRNQRKYIF